MTANAGNTHIGSERKISHRMKVKLNSISGIDDAILTMYFSRGTWNWALDQKVRDTVRSCTNRNGQYHGVANKEDRDEYNRDMTTWLKYAPIHATMATFMDLSFTVEGMHRAGQDDWDSHAKRMDNRIIRQSTRLGNIEEDAKSAYYEGKILTDHEAMKILGYDIPDEIEYMDSTYVRVHDGYVLKGLEKNRDVHRGLYHESFPSNFTFKINLAQFAHVYRHRNAKGSAHPEVKELAEKCMSLITEYQPLLTRDVVMSIQTD